MKFSTKNFFATATALSLLALPVLVGAFAPTALALSGKDGRRAAVLDEVFAKLDANKDGVIEKAEFDAFRDQRFQVADSNKDGALSRPEVREARREIREEWRQKHGLLARRDANQDGTITREEFLAAPEARFDKLDTNKDGKLDSSELEAAREARRERSEERAEKGSDNDDDRRGGRGRWHGEKQARHDGSESDEGGHHGERSRGPLGEMFADLRRDGQLSRAEIDEGTNQIFKRFDADGDGRVTREEAEKAVWHWHGKRG